MSSTGDTAPLSNVAQIPLPPGMNLAEFQDLQAHLSECLYGGLSVVGDRTSSRNRHYHLCCIRDRCVGLVSDLNYIHGLD